jgi:hypothetical protein
MRVPPLLALLAAVLVAGCSANVTYTPVPDAEADKTARGIRYYGQASPYLLVYTNSRGGLKWQIVFLPDQTTKMSASPAVIGGRSELTMYFQNGVLTSITETGDTTALVKALISAAQSALPLIAASMSKENTTVPAPYLYKIVFENGKTSFYGQQGSEPIIVPTLPGK